MMHHARRAVAACFVALSLLSATGCNARLEANKQVVFTMALQRYGTLEAFRCLDYIIMRESAYDERATGALGDYGIPQAYPAKKLATAGSDWRTSPFTQTRWMMNYVDGRYGGPCPAAAFKRARGWY